MGLVNQVVPKADLERFTRDYALTMARNAPLTLRSAKTTVEQLLKPAADRDLALLDRLITDCFNSQDYQEGVKAFSEKRRPRSRAASARIRAHLLRWRPRQPAQRTESTPRRLPSGAASPLDPSPRASWVSPTGS